MASVLVIEAQNLDATVATIKQLPGVGEVVGVPYTDENGMPVGRLAGGKYQTIHVSGNGQLVEFAMRSQGYARVVKAIH